MIKRIDAEKRSLCFILNNFCITFAKTVMTVLHIRVRAITFFVILSIISDYEEGTLGFTCRHIGIGFSNYFDSVDTGRFPISCFIIGVLPKHKINLGFV